MLNKVGGWVVDLLREVGYSEITLRLEKFWESRTLANLSKLLYHR
jgi:hypothetical protein